MEQAAFGAINSLAGHNGVLDWAGKFAATDGLYVIGLVAAVFGLATLAKSAPAGTSIALTAMAALALAGLAVLLLGHLVYESRPFVSHEGTVQLISHAADNSFPSEHATAEATVAVIGALAWRRWAAVFLGLAAIGGMARVYVGVHYPADILAGWAIGSTAAIAGWLTVYPFALQRVPQLQRRWG